MRVRAARHGRLRRRSLLRRVRRVRQGRPRRHPGPDHRAQPRARGGTAARAADAVVPQHVVVGRRTTPSRSLREAEPGTVQAVAPRHSATYWLLLRRRAGAAVHRERDQHAARFGTSRMPSPYVKDAFHDYVVDGQTDGREPGADGHQGRGALHARRSRGRQRTVRLRLAAAEAAAIRSQRSTPRSRAAAPRRTSSMRAITPLDADRGPAPWCMRQALAGMLWSKQFYYFDLERWLREHKSHPLLQSGPARRAQHALVPHDQRRRHLDAGQVGVPVVRGVGPGLSLRARWRWWTSTLPRTSSLLMLREPVPASERPDPRVRMELRRRQSAGARVGDAVRCTGREAAAGAGDLRFLERVVPEAAAQLHLVGQPQGSDGTQRLRGRLPRPRQHRRLRSQRAAADRRLAGAGGRHGVDGVLLPEHAGDRAGDSPSTIPIYEEMALKFFEHFMWIAAPMDRIGEHHDEMWDEEDGFFYDVLRLPDGEATRLKVRSMVGLLPLCAVDRDRGESRQATTRSSWSCSSAFRERHPELVSNVAPTDDRLAATRIATAVDPQRGEAAPRAARRCWTRTSS